MQIKVSREGGLDIVRVLAVFLVTFAHFTFTAHHRVGISTINNSEVIVNDSEWAFLIVDVFLSSHFSTYMGTIGVALFFITTGYLMPLMLERYGRREFLINRVLRIAPTLIVSILLTWGCASWCGRAEFGFMQFLHSVFLTFSFWGVSPIIPVLWTLAIEVLFYALCFGIGSFSRGRLPYVMGAVFAVSMGVHFTHFEPLEYMVKYLLIILSGSALFFLHRGTKEDFWVNVAFVVIGGTLWGGVFTFSEPTSPYGSASTVIVTLGIVSFLLFYPLQQRRFIGLLADVVYPLYLLHFTFGLSVMIGVKTFFSENPYVMIGSAYISVLALSFLVHFAVERPFYFSIKERLRRKI